MKKFITFFLVLILIFSFSTCGNPPKEIESITDSSNDMGLAEEAEIFFEDDNYFYRFSNVKSQYVIVKYTDGSSENIKESLENGHIQITDLDKYNINYHKETKPKPIETIIDLTQSGEICTNDTIEMFYSDNTYNYCFASIRSHYVIVYYKDGTEQNVKDALADGRININDLDRFGIKYYKDPIE